MQLSICSWTFGNIPIIKVLNDIYKIGFDAVELQASVALSQTKEIKKIINNLDLSIGGLTGDAAWPDETKDLSNNNYENRRKAIEYFKSQIKVCNELGGKYIVICPSAVGKSFCSGKDKEDWNWAIDSVAQLSQTAKEENIDLIIEPINRYESSIINTAKDAYSFVNELNHSNVKMLVDTYHMNIEETNSVEAIENVAEKLAVFHLADNNRQGIGMGQIDFQSIFQKLQQINYSGPLVLECMAPGANPFSANKKNMDDLYIYAEHSLNQLKGLLGK